MGEADIEAARARMRAKVGGGARVGGKGTVRRKKKAVSKAANSNDKKIFSSFRRLGVNPINGIDSVVFIMDEKEQETFKGAQLAGHIGANTFVVAGKPERGPLDPTLVTTGFDAAALEKLLAQATANNADSGAAEEGDDDMPELVENFEEVSEKPE